MLFYTYKGAIVYITKSFWVIHKYSRMRKFNNPTAKWNCPMEYLEKEYLFPIGKHLSIGNRV
jgi:hypothetical protein